ncbi:MAG TPA: MFS transporter [Nocardioides sp.]|uniref:MFS transporter n=1 Tax=Nocardioides sp. TaxID=35761 RepID=UPI002F40C829
MSRRLVPRVLREEPQYRLLFGSQVLSVLGDRVTSVALPFAVLSVGGGVRDVALTSTAQFLPFVVLAVPAGVWADRWERKRILISSDVVRLVTQTLAAVLLLTGTAEVVHLVVLAAAFGAADAFFAPAFSGLLPTTVDPGNLQPANALRGLTFSLANVAGPVLAGVLIGYAGGPGSALGFDAATFLVSVLLLVPLRPSVVEEAAAEDERAAPASFRSSLREGWREVRSRTWVLGYLGGFSVYHAMVLPAIFVIGPVLMQDHYDGARSWALVTALFGIGNIVGDVLLLLWRPNYALRVGALMLVGSSCQAAIIGSHLPVWGIGLLELLTGVCVTGMFTLWETSLGEHIPSGSLSRVSSYDYLSSTGMIPLGNVVVGALAALLGIYPALVVMTVVGIGAALVVVSIPSVRHLPRRPLTGSSA